MGYIDDLKAARDAAAAKLKALYEADEHHVTYTVNGQSFSWNEYAASLLGRIRDLDALIVAQDDYDVELTELYTLPHPRG
jgi:hypothetical protein